MSGPLRLLLTILALLLPGLAVAQTAPPPGATGRALVVATHQAPPFAMKDARGQWSGLAIDLWRQVAADLHQPYHLVETDLPGMTAGVASGQYDLSVGALTVTPGRERRIDFTHPYYTTGFGIVTGKAPPSWLILVRNFFTWGFLSAVLLLGAVLLIVGLLFWWVEHRHNDEFGGRSWRGIGSGFWFSAVTMTTVGYGDKAPRTPAGRVIAVVWMFAAILIISTFTGMISSSLTEGRLSGAIRGQDDLAGARVGSISGAASDEWLRENGIAFTAYPNLQAGLDAVAAGDLDAFVYDRPLLRYLVNAHSDHRLRLLPGVFGRQDYAFGLPQTSPIREAINQRLLQHIDDPRWSDEVQQVLGKE